MFGMLDRQAGVVVREGLTARAVGALGRGLARARAASAPAAACACGLAVCLGLHAAAYAQATKPAAGPAVSEARVSAAIRRGLDWLYAKQKANGTWDNRYSRQQPAGAESLAVLAALWAGEDANRPQLAKALGYAKRIEPTTVYARSVRALVYARLAGEDYHRRLAADVKWLMQLQDRAGGWGYGTGHPTTSQRPEWADTSNSQFALLALSEAAAAGVAVPELTWAKAMKFWTAAQNPDGGWGYEPPGGTRPRFRAGSYGSLTTAGLASVFITLDELAPLRAPKPGEMFATTDAPQRKAIDGGLAWLAKHYAPDRVPRWVWGASEDWLLFYLLQLSRVAETAGLRTIAGQDWWPQVAGHLLTLQRPDGSWSASADPKSDPTKDAAIRTAMAVMVLAKGRAPVAVAKLSCDGRWSGHHRDAANFTRWLGRRLGRPVAWQLLDGNATRTTMADAPVLYMQPPQKFEVSGRLSREIRAYVQGGGTLVVQSVPGDKQFGARLEAWAAQLLPELRASRLQAGHPIFHARFKTPRLEVAGLGDALRTRVFILLDDLSGPMHYARSAEAEAAMRQWANLVLYAVDMELPAGRLDARPPQPAPAGTIRTVTVGRLRHADGWNVCPQAMRRLHCTLANALSLGVDEKSVSLEEPVPKEIALLWLTGTRVPPLSKEQAARLREYVEGGGTLFADPAAGGEEFCLGFRKLVREAFGRDLQELKADDPLITGRFGGGVGADVSKVGFTRAGRAKAGADRGRPVLHGLRIGGRLAIVLSGYAVTCPMEGLAAYGVVGLSTSDACRLAANVALYAAFKPGR